MFSSLNSRVCMFLLFILFVCLVLPQFGIAADDFADMGENIEEQSRGLAGAAQMIFYLLGFVLFGAGLIMLAMSTDRKLALVCLFVGVGLLSIGFFISIFTGSLFSSDVSQTDQLLE